MKFKNLLFNFSFALWLISLASAGEINRLVIQESFNYSYPADSIDSFNYSLSLVNGENYYGKDVKFGSHTISYQHGFWNQNLKQHPFASQVDDRSCFVSFVLKPKLNEIVEEGDILLEIDPSFSSGIKDLYHSLSNGISHAALVTYSKDSKTFSMEDLIHVDSPKIYSGKFDQTKSYIILRLKKFPAQISGHEEFHRFINNELEVKNFIQAYHKQKANIIKSVRALRDWNYSYLFDLKGGDPIDQDYIAKCLANNKDPKKLKIYCTQVVQIGYLDLFQKIYTKKTPLQIIQDLAPWYHTLDQETQGNQLARYRYVTEALQTMVSDYGSTYAGLDQVEYQLHNTDNFFLGQFREILTFFSQSFAELQKSVASGSIESIPEFIQSIFQSSLISPVDFYQNIISNPRSPVGLVGIYVPNLENASLPRGECRDFNKETDDDFVYPYPEP